MKNFYNVLELDKNCTAKEIKDSYIKLTKKYHPDKNKSKEAEKKIIEINEAYSVLKNSSTRYQYDDLLQKNNAQQQHRENSHQNNREYYYKRTYTYEDFVRYHNVRTQAYAEPSVSSRKLTAVVCCCMLMVFGAGLRIMYAGSEAYRRKRLSEATARNISETQHRNNPNVEELRMLFKRKLERELERKKSKP